MKTTKEKIYLAEFKQFSEKKVIRPLLWSGIASELAISKSALYQHFTSKLDLFEKQQFQCLANKHFIDDMLQKKREFFNREVDNKLINLVDCRFWARQFRSVITLQIHNRIKRRNSIINIWLCWLLN